MSEPREMSLDTAIDIVARWEIWQMYEAWAEREDLWENVFPEFGEFDVQVIIGQVERIMPTDVTFEMYEDARKVLTDRATGEGDG